MNKKKCLKYSVLSILTIFLILFDQFAKHLVVNKLDLEKNHTVIHNIFSFEYLENRGIAFGIMSGKMTLITIVVLIVVMLIVYMVFALENAISQNSRLFFKFSFIQVLCSFMIAGAIGNLIDRIRLGYVIDFIKFDFVDFPTFNVADCYMN